MRRLKANYFLYVNGDYMKSFYEKIQNRGKKFELQILPTESELFRRWLQKEVRLDEKSVKLYLGALIELNNYIKRNSDQACNLFAVDITSALSALRFVIDSNALVSYLKKHMSDKEIIYNALNMLLDYERFCLKRKTINWKKGDSNRILFVHKGTISCQRNRHNVIPVTAVLLGKFNQSVELNVNFCEECQLYFIDEVSFKYYRKQYDGILIGNILFKDEQIKCSDYNFLADKSPLMLCGYNVNQQSGLAKNERQYIISKMIDLGFMSKSDIIKYLSFFIKRNGKKVGNDAAVKKWKDDLDFVLKYKIKTQSKSEIEAIKKYADRKHS